jgi:hypothetical protein
MILLYILMCLVSGVIGFSTCAIFSARQYEKGFKDGRGQYDE